ncbi:hypothetical protein NBRC116494_24700 [Aurantivibrio plasticivorans]
MNVSLCAQSFELSLGGIEGIADGDMYRRFVLAYGNGLAFHLELNGCAILATLVMVFVRGVQHHTAVLDVPSEAIKTIKFLINGFGESVRSVEISVYDTIG